VLDREDPPRFWVLLDENVLHREIGGAKIMHEQLGHLAEMAARPRTTVQVIPRVGAHVGLSGAFGIAETPDAHIAYIDHIADAMTTDSPAMVAMVSERFDVLRSEAYRRSESLTLIKEMTEKWAP
jgi:hypothetical protein